jgi:hypothetical protein
MVMQSQNSIGKEESFTTTKPKRKRVNNEEKLQDGLDRLRIELSNYKSEQKFLENQFLQEKKMKTFLNQ